MDGRSVRGREQEELAAANLAELFHAPLIRSGRQTNQSSERPDSCTCRHELDIDSLVWMRAEISHWRAGNPPTLPALRIEGGEGVVRAAELKSGS
jgi:hypothetical protein